MQTSRAWIDRLSILDEGTAVRTERTGETIRRIAFRLLSHDSVFSTVQRMLLSTLDARRAVERNIERLLAAANLPSARDFERVIVQLGELDREILGLTRRLAKLSKHDGSKGAPEE